MLALPEPYPVYELMSKENKKVQQKVDLSILNRYLIRRDMAYLIVHKAYGFNVDTKLTRSAYAKTWRSNLLLLDY
jgi:hypothetical protein